MSLDFCKWDAQVGDISTLFPQPLLMSAGVWNQLSALAERLAIELDEAEEELLLRPELFGVLGVPKPLCFLSESRSLRSQRPSVRTLRFDFHLTTDGWRISEVNSDVPGGFTEASQYSQLMSQCCSNTRRAGDPANEWTQSVLEIIGGSGRVALLSAVGFLEDQQVTAFLAGQLQAHGIETFLVHDPAQFVWRDGIASVRWAGRDIELNAIVRFYQAEWLAQLPQRSNWETLLFASRTPVMNPASSLLTESKRFPLVWNHLSCKLETWRSLMPESQHPSSCNYEEDGSWVAKGAYSNNGDEVFVVETADVTTWAKISRLVRRNPNAWVLQRRFETVPVHSNAGALYPCIGVYTINGRAAGVYARANVRPTIDYSAFDVALLIAEDERAEQG
jgi:glutathionylspermidine synthase